MRLLADAGCDTAATSSKGKTALMSAAESNVPDAVRLALAKGWGELEARSNGGMTAFLWACYKGSAECMKLLVDAGCDTAAKNDKRETSLMLAAHSGVPTAIRMLLKNGCELEVFDLLR